MMYAIYSDSIIRATGFTPIRQQHGRTDDDFSDHGLAARTYNLFNAIERLFSSRN